MEPRIIFEDDQILVLDKPAGWVVNRAETTKAGETVQEWVEKKLKVKSEKLKVDKDLDFYRRAGIVHRLDKETSGLLLVAKTPQAFENLQKQFKERKVKKRYLALVHGKVAPSEGEITASVGRLPWNYKKFGVLPGGREAKTRYHVLSIMYKVLGGKKKPFSFLELTPETGRTHQIRIHLKYLGYPIVADTNYAGRKNAREDRKWCPRMFLHASSLSFTHPVTQKTIKFDLPLPGDLNRALNTFLIP